MSKTTAGSFHGMHFWVYDVCKALLVAEMVAAAEQMPPDARPAWLPAVVRDLRVATAISDFFLPFDEWAEGHEDEFLSLIGQACERLTRRRYVTADDAAAWIVLDDMTVIWRGEEILSTEEVVTFGRSLIAMAAGTYPSAPPGHQWLFGWPGDPQTLAVRYQ